jgi:Phycobilisome protein
MLSQLNTLMLEADGRYATDAELMFLQNYLKTARLRFSAYQKLQAAEPRILEQMIVKLKAVDPTFLQLGPGNSDSTVKSHRDGQYFFRYATQALLVDDTEAIQEQLLLWLQTIKHAFKHERCTRASYSILEELVQQYLSADEAKLMAPIFESARNLIGQV